MVFLMSVCVHFLLPGDQVEHVGVNSDFLFITFHLQWWQILLVLPSNYIKNIIISYRLCCYHLARTPPFFLAWIIVKVGLPIFTFVPLQFMVNFWHRVILLKCPWLPPTLQWFSNPLRKPKPSELSTRSRWFPSNVINGLIFSPSSCRSILAGLCSDLEQVRSAFISECQHLLFSLPANVAPLLSFSSPFKCQPLSKAVLITLL